MEKFGEKLRIIIKLLNPIKFHGNKDIYHSKEHMIMIKIIKLNNIKIINNFIVRMNVSIQTNKLKKQIR